MSNIINFYQQEDESIDDCVLLSPRTCAEYLLWADKNDKRAEYHFAMCDSDFNHFGAWWGIKVAFEFDFTVVMCGHFGGFGQDFEAISLNQLRDEHRYDEDVCEAKPSKRDEIILTKFIEKVNKDYDGNPDYIVVETHDDIIEWLTKVKGKTIVRLDTNKKPISE